MDLRNQRLGVGGEKDRVGDRAVHDSKSNNKFLKVLNKK